MPKAPTVLVVDDTDQHLRYLSGIVADSLAGWTIVTAGSESEAMKQIHDLSEIEIAVVDLCLTDPPDLQEGLAVLNSITEKAPKCFRILVTGKKREWEVEDNRNVDRFVSIHHTNSDQRGQLEKALAEGKRRSSLRREYPESKPACTMVVPQVAL